jgi:hypothetical protein
MTMPAAGDVKQLASSSNAMGFDVYGRVKSTPGNLVMSPASMSAALAMTYGGARGETEAQMKRVLHLEGARDAVMADWGNLSRALQDPARPHADGSRRRSTMSFRAAPVHRGARRRIRRGLARRQVKGPRSCSP